MLNDDLYNRLLKAIDKGLFGGNRIKVTNANVKMSGHSIPDPSNPARKKFQITEWGETYQVCCPWCGDTRHRLYISHMFNEYDADTKTKNKHLIKCFNEDCQQDSEFIEYVINSLSTISVMLNTTNKPKLHNIIQGAIKKIELPVGIVDVASLPLHHRACAYLLSRGHDPHKVANAFDLRWYEGNGTTPGSSRIIVPMYNSTGLYAWQGRYVTYAGSGDCTGLHLCANVMCGQTIHSDDAKSVKCSMCNTDLAPIRLVKWYTAPGSKIGDNLYNYNQAKHYPYVIITEGPADVWRVGNPQESDAAGPAVAVSNKKLTTNQTKLLDHWINFNGACFLLFDGDAKESTYSQLNKLRTLFGNRVVAVDLPDDKDPGDLPHNIVWKYIYESADKAGIGRLFTEGRLGPVSTGVPSCKNLRAVFGRDN
jgi:hypothetical protein